MDLETIFGEAVQKPTLQERLSFLEQACGGDAELRTEVDSLLRAHVEAAGFLDAPPAGVTAAVEAAGRHVRGPTVNAPATASALRAARANRRRRHGRGLHGRAASAGSPPRRAEGRQARSGYEGSHRRFGAERQALAMMDHPNIAKVLDAGSTDTGRPYFVMELVRGIPITQYCDEQKLAPRERLELFAQVCHAVQHAHTKGIIHRDLKPTNVLVTLNDGDKPVPKVIDFGIAKATAGQRLTEHTLFTEFRQLVGTPLYMSPEQAEMSALLDVDTRSDVYSLGVLLYELLTGTTPFDKQRLAKAAYDEIRRIIREEEPPRPSTRLSTLGDTLPNVSALRRTEPKRWGNWFAVSWTGL
jgi:serine/threonine protein kinase